MVLGEQPGLGAVVAAVGGVGVDPLRGAVWTTASSFLVTRSWWVSVVVSTCQLPNGSSSRASTASRAGAPGAWLAVNACVSSYVTTWSWRPALRST